MRTKHKLVHGTIAVAVSTVLVLVASTAQAASVRPGFAPAKSSVHSVFDAKTLALMAAQQPLTAAVQRIEAAAGSGNHGLAGTAIDVPHQSITVYWHGTVPKAVTAEIDRTRSHRITVTVLPAAYSRAQFDAEMKRLESRSTAEANLHHTKPLIASVRVRDDYSGIDIGVTSDPVAATSMLSPSRGDLVSSMPASTHHEDVMRTMATRQADTTPFYGGGAMKAATVDSKCSTGWAVHDSSRTYILSSAHCGWFSWNTWSNTPMGRTSKIAYSFDAQVIATSSQDRIYIGTSIADTTGAGQSTRQVVGILPLEEGTELCADGAFSGLQCNAKVTSAGPREVAVKGADGIYRDAMLWVAASQTSNTIAGTGDSGGPLFGVTGPGGSEILAAGTITGGTSAVGMKCNGVPQSSTRDCDTTIVFGAVSDELGALGVTLS